MKKLIVAVFCLMNVCALGAQEPAMDSLTTDTAIDVAVMVDTVAAMPVDTLTPQLLRVPGEAYQLRVLDSLTNGFFYEQFSLQRQLDVHGQKPKKVTYQTGEQRQKGEVWILMIISFLLILFAILKNTFGKQLWAVVQAFYSNRALATFNKEEHLLTSWSFLLLFVQFGFTIGMFVFLAARFEALPEAKQGFNFFLAISVSIILLYLLKILVLRFIGFMFGVQKPLGEYVSILYLSYFNASLLFIPLVIIFALSPLQFGGIYIFLGATCLILTFVFQFIRATVTILSQYRFPKMYLFLYFCTLEICPILILIKAIGLK